MACCCFICWEFCCGLGGCFVLKGREREKTESRMICCLFCCSGRLVSPKWKNFKGLKLQWRDKIRLNNAIWRAWYMQCKYRAGGGSCLRHRWEQENWNYRVVTSSGICSVGCSEAVPLDPGCPGWGQAGCSEHSPRSPCWWRPSGGSPGQLPVPPGALPVLSARGAVVVSDLEKRKNPVCHFVTPLDGSVDVDEHRRPEVCGKPGSSPVSSGAWNRIFWSAGNKGSTANLCSGFS